jgi:hypothetical protein
MKISALLLSIALLVPLAFARVEDYGPRRYTQVGRHERGGPEVVIDRRHGPGWGGVIASGLIGAAAGYALGAAAAPPPVVVGTVVPYLPAGCVTVPSYGGYVYNCGGFYYQPFYQGTSLMYQIVPTP